VRENRGDGAGLAGRFGAPGTRITAGVLLANVYRRVDDSYLGGFACEYAGNGSPEEAEANLREAMQQLFARRYKPKLYRLDCGKLVIRTYTPENRSGPFLSALASPLTLCRY